MTKADDIAHQVVRNLREADESGNVLHLGVLQSASWSLSARRLREEIDQVRRLQSLTHVIPDER